MKLSRIAAACVTVGLLLAFCGCSSLLAPRPDRSRFYVLTAVANPRGSVPASGHTANSLRIGLGPITLPGYLDRPEMVTRVSANRLHLSQENQWAEPLRTNFANVMGEDLSAGLGNPQIVRYPWYASTPIDYQVKVNVDRFESTGQGSAVLAAKWEICDPTDGRVLLASRSNISETLSSAEPSAAVAALSRALAALSHQIALGVRSLRPSAEKSGE